MGDNGTDRFRVRRFGREARQAFGPRPGQSVYTLQTRHHRSASLVHGQLSVYSDSRIGAIPISEATPELSVAEAPRSLSCRLPSTSPRSPPMEVRGMEHGAVCSEWRSKLEPRPG